MEFQMFLIWHNAIEAYSYIIQKLSSCFLIKRVYETTWTREETLNNIKRLYQCTFSQAQTPKQSFPSVDMEQLLLLLLWKILNHYQNYTLQNTGKFL